MARVAVVGVLLAGACLAGYDALSVSGEWLIGGYRAVLSPLQGQNVCNFWPTCSRFTSAAIKSQGFFPGLLIGSDRLMRCNSIAWSYFDTYYHDGVIGGRMSDPVESHIAWRRPPDEPGLVVAAQSEQLGTRSELSDNSVMSRRAGQSPLSASPSLSFADYLYSLGEYEQAAGEYLRMKFASCSPNLNSFAGLMAAESYLRAGQPARARRAFEDMGGGASVQDFRRYGIARTRFAEADYLGSRVILDSIVSGALRDRSRALSGWGLFRQRRFAEGASVLGTVATEEPTRRLSAMDGNGIPRRSRLLGSLLAVIPGAGHAYAGRAGDGAYSFLSVVGTGLVAWWFADDPTTRDRTRVKVSIFGVLTALFYAGNVYGANVAARDYNLLQERRYVQRADSLFRLLSLEPDYRVLLDTVSADTTAPGRE